MDEHLAERLVVGGSDEKLVVNATATIDIAVHQYDDMLEGDSRKEVVQTMNVLRHQVAFAIERVVMGVDWRAFPLP